MALRTIKNRIPRTVKREGGDSWPVMAENALYYGARQADRLRTPERCGGELCISAGERAGDRRPGPFCRAGCGGAHMHEDATVRRLRNLGSYKLRGLAVE